MSSVKVMLFVGVIAAMMQGSVSASTGPQERGRPALPPEAIDACKDKSAGDAVEVATPRGDTIKATCRQIDGQLVAIPQGGPGGPGNGGPPVREGNGQ